MPQNNADGKSELYVPNGISQPDAVSDNQHLRKIIGDLCKLLENESALSAKQTPGSQLIIPPLFFNFNYCRNYQKNNIICFLLIA